MSIKSKLGDKDPAVRGFPKLMIAPTSGVVVLFTEYGSGVIVESVSGSDVVGYHSLSWVMGDFTDFNGTVPLWNGAEV